VWRLIFVLWECFLRDPGWGGGARPEGAAFRIHFLLWLSVVTDLQGRGVRDIFIACMDGLTGFKDAIRAVFPETQIQRCIIHQTPAPHHTCPGGRCQGTQCGASVRNSLKYVTWSDRKLFMADLRLVYQAATREAAEAQLRQLHQK
jgi:putative transposase